MIRSEPDVWSLRGPFVTGVIAIIVLVAGFGSWAATGQLSGAVIAQGYVIASRLPQVVHHPDGGIVAKIHISNGDRVAADEPLVTLEDKALATELGLARSRRFDLNVRQARLAAERAGTARVKFPPDLLRAAKSKATRQRLADEQALFFARRHRITQETAQMEERGAQTDSRLMGLKAQQKALATQLELIARQLIDQTQLQAQGLSPASRVAALQREEARLIGAIEDASAQIDQTRAARAELDADHRRIATLRTERSLQESLELDEQISVLDQKIQAMQARQDALTITAPIAGSVHQLAVAGERSYLPPGQPILRIVPDLRAPLIRVDIPPNDVSDLSLGQTVKLRFPSLAGRFDQDLPGKISHISADRVIDDTQTAPVYRVEIMISPDALARLPTTATLIAGMPAQAFIQTGSQTPLSYLLEPFTDYLSHAMREG